MDKIKVYILAAVPAFLAVLSIVLKLQASKAKTDTANERARTAERDAVSYKKQNEVVTRAAIASGKANHEGAENVKQAVKGSADNRNHFDSDF